MLRTFHARTNKMTLFLCLMPTTVMAIYGFWTKQIWLGFGFMFFMVICVERLIHTIYIISDSGELIISYGRFARKRTIAILDIEKIELFKPTFPTKLWRNDWIGLTLKSGRVVTLQPVSIQSFCSAVLKKQEELCTQ